MWILWLKGSGNPGYDSQKAAKMVIDISNQQL